MNAAHIIVPICAFLYFTKAEIHKSQKSPQTIENHIMEVLYMHHENTNLLNEVSKASKLGIDAINILLPKIKKEDLKKELKDQCSEYQKLQAKANEAMSEYNVTPSKEKMMEQTMLWGSIQMNTLLDSSEQHIAEMMINGTTMGIIDMTKKLNELEQPKAKEKEIAEEFIENSQAYIDMWKNYL